MTPEREREFDELLAYLCFFATHVWHISPDANVHPATTVKQLIALFGKSKALTGLRQAVNDTVEDASDWSREARTTLDRALTEAGIITLSEVARRYASAYKRIVKRGTIKNETEYYLLNGILVDQASGIPDAERMRMQEIVAAYESTLTS